jgi:hypothetical protein
MADNTSSLADLFASTEQKYNLPSGYLTRTAQIESGTNPNAKNPNSSAGGLFQFINSTAKQYGLQNRFDPYAATEAAARLAQDNSQLLRRALGRDPSAGELYFAHQQGGGGAAKLLSVPDARAADIVGLDAIRLNGGRSDMTASDFAQKWIGKFGGSAQKTAMTRSPALSGPAQTGGVVPTQNAPQEPFAPPEAANPMLSVLARMFQAQQSDDQTKQRRQAEEEDRAKKRRALLSDPFMFG